MGEWVATAPLGVFLGMLALPAAILGIGLYASLRAARLARTIARMPTTTLGAAAPGYVELEGTIEALPDRVLTARLTGAPVAWSRSKVEEYVSSARSDSQSSTWRTLTEHTSDEPFVLRDASGACVILPAGAEVTPTDRSVWYGSTPVPTDRNPPRVGPGESPEGLLRVASTRAHRYRYTEERIYVGDPLYALGELAPPVEDEDADEERDADADPSEDAPSVGPSLGMLRLIAPGTRAQPFVLSTTPQDELAEAQRVGSQAALGIAGLGLALGALLVWLRLG